MHKRQGREDNVAPSSLKGSHDDTVNLRAYASNVTIKVQTSNSSIHMGQHSLGPAQLTLNFCCCLRIAI